MTSYDRDYICGGCQNYFKTMTPYRGSNPKCPICRTGGGRRYRSGYRTKVHPPKPSTRHHNVKCPCGWEGTMEAVECPLFCATCQHFVNYKQEKQYIAPPNYRHLVVVAKYEYSFITHDGYCSAPENEYVNEVEFKTVVYKCPRFVLPEHYDFFGRITEPKILEVFEIESDGFCCCGHRSRLIKATVTKKPMRT